MIGYRPETRPGRPSFPRRRFVLVVSVALIAFFIAAWAPALREIRGLVFGIAVIYGVYWAIRQRFWRPTEAESQRQEA
jgi:hypothetical protein